MLRRALPVVLSCLLWACASTAPGLDAGLDAGGPADAGDAGAADDAGSPGDGGTMPDAGALEDAGAPFDAGLTPDAGTFACVPAMGSTKGVGTGCSGLNQAYSGRAINVGYFPYRVKAPIAQYSGDVGGGAKGVQLQVVPVGSYVGLSSDGPWYGPPSGSCFPSGSACGSAARSACPDSSPPLRPARAGFVWGYAYQGASHMQGWFPFDPSKLEFAGFSAHPCALGPAGLDYEVETACGQALTACSGGTPTCGDKNPCSEGKDDCADTTCGATQGGPYTPTAHRMTLTPPAGHTCTKVTPPLTGVTCLDNGPFQDFFFVYPFGAYLYWAQNSTTKAWLHTGDQVQAYFTNVDSQGVRWYFVEVLKTGAPTLTPASDGAGAGGACSASTPGACEPCKNGGVCGWIQSVFLQ